MPSNLANDRFPQNGDPIFIYVDPLGDDDNDGMSPKNVLSGGGPLASPAAALRLLSNTNSLSTRVVLLAPGVYELSETLRFTGANSGSVSSPVIWRGMGPGVIFSGGCQLSGWQIGHHRGLPSWTLVLPEVAQGLWNFTQLWASGNRRPRPRLPKSGYFRFTGTAGHGDSGFRWHAGPRRAEFRQGDLHHFEQLAEIRLITVQLWMDCHHVLTNVDEDLHEVDFKTASISSLIDESGLGARYWLENVYESLCTPGEWYLNRLTGQLTYLPMPGEDPSSAKIVAPRLDCLLDIMPNDEAPVGHLTFENVTFAHQEWARSPDNPGAVQAASDVPGALRVSRSDHVDFRNCTFTHVAGYALQIANGSQCVTVAGCKFHDLGGGGVRVDHEVHLQTDPALGMEVKPDPRWLRRSNTTIHDSLIFDAGKIFRGSAGIWIGNAGGCRIFRNELYNLSWVGISSGWSWGYGPTRTVGNRIELNHIHHLNLDRLFSDLAGIYTLGSHPGGRICCNHIHHIARFHYSGSGIYTDEGSSHMVINGNLIHDTEGHPFFINYARFLTISDNHFISCSREAIYPGKVELTFGNLFTHNLIEWAQGELSSNIPWLPHAVLAVDNQLWPGDARQVSWPRGSLAAEQSAGQWLNTTIAQPTEMRPASLLMNLEGPRKDGGIDGLDEPSDPCPSFSLHLSEISRSRDNQGSFFLNLRIVVEHIGGLYLDTSLTLSADVPDMDLPKRWDCRLEPLASITMDFTIQVSSNFTRLRLLLNGTSSTSSLLNIALPPRVYLPVIDAFRPSLAHSAVGAMKAWRIIHDECELASVFAARTSGDYFALQINVRDPRIRRDDNEPWRGSCVEIFLANGDGRLVAHLILQPGLGNRPARLTQRGYGELPISDTIDWCISATGWNSVILISLNEHDINPDDFRFEVQINCSPLVPEQIHLRKQLFSDGDCFRNSAGYAHACTSVDQTELWGMI